jgi:nucleoid-associated protein YgaU
MSRYFRTKVDKFDLLSKYKDRKGNVAKYNTTIYNPTNRAMSEQLDGKNTDMYVITQEGDRLDNLANEYYKDPNLWWFIARVNNLSTMNVPAGTSLRIPSSTTDAAGE